MEEEISVEYYESDSGKCYYIDWESKLTREIRSQVWKRINRLRVGNFGDCKQIEGGDGVFELRIHTGPGYRIYFGKKGKRIVVLLCGGDKGSQTRDINRAKKYWQDCH